MSRANGTNPRAMGLNPRASYVPLRSKASPGQTSTSSSMIKNETGSLASIFMAYKSRVGDGQKSDTPTEHKRKREIPLAVKRFKPSRGGLDAIRKITSLDDDEHESNDFEDCARGCTDSPASGEDGCEPTKSIDEELPEEEPISLSIRQKEVIDLIANKKSVCHLTELYYKTNLLDRFFID
jgi:hypothetical protein